MKSVEGTDNDTAKTPQITKILPKLSSSKFSNPFMNSSNTADGFQNDEFDRRSAGNRFGASAYHEFMKVNNLFSGVAFKRRQSCSKSQSHSRVRMQPSIYDHGNDEYPLRNKK